MIKHLKRHFHLKYKNNYVHAKKLFIFDIGLLMLALFMLASSLFFFFWKPGITGLIDLEFSWGGERIKSGEEITLTVNYKNRSKLLLQNSELAIHLPEGFVINREKTPITSFSEQSVAELGEIKPGGTGSVQIIGHLYAEPGVDNKILALLTYLPEEKTEKEQKISAGIVRVVDSVIQTKLILTDTAFPEQKIPVKLKIINTGDTDLTDIEIENRWPEKFIAEDKLKNISLKSGETKEINGQITSPQQTGEHNFGLAIKIKINNKIFTQININKIITIFYPELFTQATILPTKTYVEPGNTVPIKISWQNNSEFPLENLKISLTPTLNIINLPATARENNLKIEGDKLVMDKTNRTALTDGSPKKGGEMEIKLILSPVFNISQKQAKFGVDIEISAQVPTANGQNFTRTSQSNLIPVATEVSMTSEIRYYTSDGDQIGRGPLPPTVGEETKYWVINKVVNGSNEIKDLYFTAKLADGIKLAEKQSVTLGDKLNYNSNNNTVSWSYSDAPAFGQIGLYFELSIIPSSQDVGKNIPLVQTIQFSATDADTGKKINLSQKNLSNVLKNDDLGHGKGSLVVE
jgi:hypothetical protein